MGAKAIRRGRHILRKELFGGLVIDRRTGALWVVNRTGYEIARLLLRSGSVTPDTVSSALVEKYGRDKTQIISEDVNKIAERLFSDRIQTADAIPGNETCSNGFEGQLSAPLDVFWEITWRCNLNCIHCYSSSGSRGASVTELSTNEAIALLHELRDAGVHRVIIGGGEPLIRPDLFEIIGAGTKAGLNVVLVSNGTLFSEERCNEFLRSGLSDVAISIDGSNPEIHDGFRNCKGAFNKTIENCKRLIAKGVKVHVQTSVSRNNISDIARIIELCIGMGVTSWSAKFLMPAGRAKGVSNVCLEPSEFESFRNLLENPESGFRDRISIGELPSNYSFDYSLEKKETSDGPLSCGAGVTTCGITPDGRLLACSYLQDEAWISGRVPPRRLSETWRKSKIFDPFRKLMRSSLSECINCRHFDLCKGGCRARAYLSRGDFFGKDCASSYASVDSTPGIS